MRLSEALVLKAEWWAIPIGEFEAECEIEDLLESLSTDAPDMFYETSEHFRKAYPEHKFMPNDTTITLCLLESELQKDEELELKAKTVFKEMWDAEHKTH